MGVGYGLTGRSFAIPTKGVVQTLHGLGIGNTLRTLHIDDFVQGFLAFAHCRPDLQFQVTRIGCGLAGLQDEDMAHLFVGGQPNVFYDTAWKPLLTDDSQFWGTF